MANALFTMADVEMAHFAEPDVRIEYVPTTVNYGPGNKSGNYDKYSSITPGHYVTRPHYRRTPSGRTVGIREVWRSSSPKQKAAIVGATALAAAGSYLLNKQIWKTIAAGAEKQKQKQKRSR